jgi:hypothetical protein
VHRNFRVSGDPGKLREIAKQLEPLTGIISLELDENGSMKPRGGVLTVQSLNRSADEVLRRVQQAARQGRVVVEIASADSIIDVQRQEQIDFDADEMLWEEMEQNLRNQGRLSTNSVALMALGGVISAAAVAAHPLMQVAAFIAASIVAPGFDTIAAVSLGVVLHRWHVVRRALLSSVVGYAVLIAAAALTFLLLHALHEDGASTAQNLGSVEIVSLGIRPFVLAAALALAGALMIVSLRDIYVVGPLIGLALVPAASIAGCALATGDWQLMAAALRRVGYDAALIVIAAALVFWIKQRTVHQRRPID